MLVEPVLGTATQNLLMETGAVAEIFSVRVRTLPAKLQVTSVVSAVSTV